MRDLNLDKLQVLHRLKNEHGQGLSDAEVKRLLKHGPVVETCLRHVWITTDYPGIPAIGDEHSSLLQGKDAFVFLLQTVTGLNSAVPGETNVTGQFKCAWKRWTNNQLQSHSNLNNIMACLFRNSAAIRQRYLEGSGGASYGSLVRKLLKPVPGKNILFIGSGKFAHSILPFFRDWETALWNHRQHTHLETTPGTRQFAPEAAVQAAAWADYLILTTPVRGQNNDRLWHTLIANQNISGIVHLDRRRAEPGGWRPYKLNGNFFDLDDVFDLRHKQSRLRDLSLQQARIACEHILPAKTGKRIAARIDLPQRA